MKSLVLDVHSIVSVLNDLELPSLSSVWQAPPDSPRHTRQAQFLDWYWRLGSTAKTLSNHGACASYRSSVLDRFLANQYLEPGFSDLPKGELGIVTARNLLITLDHASPVTLTVYGVFSRRDYAGYKVPFATPGAQLFKVGETGGQLVALPTATGDTLWLLTQEEQPIDELDLLAMVGYAIDTREPVTTDYQSVTVPVFEIDHHAPLEWMTGLTAANRRVYRAFQHARVGINPGSTEQRWPIPDDSQSLTVEKPFVSWVTHLGQQDGPPVVVLYVTPDSWHILKVI